MNASTRRWSALSATLLALLLPLVVVDASAVAHAASASHRSTGGTCYAMTNNQVAAQSNKARRVPCSRRHTARAIALFRAPARVDINSYASIGPYAARKCDAAFAKAVGSNVAGRVLTTFSDPFFVPTKAEQARGDRTVECDLILRGGKSSLAPLPTDAEPAVHGRPPFADDVRRCYDVAGKQTYFTTCARSHDYRSTTDFRLHGKKYPGRRAFLRAGYRRCAHSESFFYPSREQWNHGFKYTVCVANTKR